MKVSIITPAYNASLFIGDCIESVIAQSYQDWEHIIIDDGSKDNTTEIVKKYIKTEPRIKLITPEKNGGPAKARELGLKKATGTYVAFLDSDDLWLPQKLERQLSFMQKNNIAFSCTQYRRITQDGIDTGRLIDIPKVVDYKGLLKHNTIATLTAVINTQMVGTLQMVDEGYDDFILWLSILKRGFKVYGLQEDLARYRLVGGSVSNNRTRAVKWVWNIYRNVEKLSLPEALWTFAHYAVRVSTKHSRF